MTDKVTLTNVASGYDLAKINENFQTIEDELNNKVLYRDNPVGTANELITDLDVNGKKLYNLPTPTLPSQAARLQDVQQAISGTPSANLVPFTPYSTLASTNVQAAIQELLDEIPPPSSSNFIAPGTGGQTRTFQSKMEDVLSTSDYSNTTQFDNAVTALTQRVDAKVLTKTGSTARKLSEKLSDVISVKDFGAKGDGVTDDRAAIVAAITAAQASLLGGIVYFPAGTYMISANITVNAVNNGAALVNFIGDGVGSTISPAASMTSMFTILGSSVDFERLNFANVSSRATRGIQIGNGSTGAGLPEAGRDVNIRNCRMASFTNAIYAWDFVDVEVDSCFFNNNTTSIYSADNTLDSRITNNYVLGGNPCLYFSKAVGGQQGEGVIITTNTLLGTSGIVLNGGLEFQICNNIVGEVGSLGYGLDVDGTTNGVSFCKVTDNWFGSAGGAVGVSGVRVRGNTQGVKLLDNTLAGFGGYGIDITGASVIDCNVVGNHFFLNQTGDLKVDAAQRIVVKHNTFKADGNPGVTNTVLEANSSQCIVTENTFLNKLPTKGAKSVYRHNFGDDVTSTIASTTRGVRGALLKQTSIQSLANAALVVLNFQSVAWDTDGCYSAGTPSRITTPSWAKKAKLTAQVSFDPANTTSWRAVTAYKNGSGTWDFRPRTYENSVGGVDLNTTPQLSTVWIPVNSGDYFEVVAAQNSGGSLNTDVSGGLTWFQVEFE